MAAAFHHGTEIIRIDGGSSPVYTVDGAITAIIGTAPIGRPNELTVCQTLKDFAQFGAALTGRGFTIPDAANIWTRYGAGIAYVVNVCDPAKHKSSVTGEILAVDAATLMAKTKFPALHTAGLTVYDGTTALTAGTHYTISLWKGEIKFKSKPVAPKISYTYTDPAKVTDADILGGFVAASGKRTGLELVTEGYSRFGADAKIIIAPGYERPAVSAGLVNTAAKLKAIAYISAPKGTGLSQAIEGRGPLGKINFQTASDRAQLFFPHVVGLLGLENLATHAAGLRMKTDVEKGYWWSISNQELLGVTGLEIGLTARGDDPQSETNRLNEKGITTVFNSYGSGFRMWGNRLACFPSVSHIKNFEVAQRTGDVIDESLRRYALQYIDRPIDEALIDSLLEGYRTYLGTLKSIVGSSVSLDYDYDLTDAFSKGQVPLVYDYTPKLPAERITNTSVMTRKYLVNLTTADR